MRLRACATPFLVALVAALPTLVSLCELRCISPDAVANVASEGTASSDCSGHETSAEAAPPSSPFKSSHDCSGHALLAKGDGAGFEFQLARAFASLSVVSSASGFVNEVSNHSATLSISTDLSPPLGRRSGVLRL